MFWADLAHDLEDPEFRRAYNHAARHIDATDGDR